ncbi:hypothetical protein [Halomonas maura]|uniref:hypothetical protein n=1 Tax=Halomonas maura TaxID=117606 RepID=UPI0025B61488|nr:hypothetical protein [Halomonas maura]MDN3556899.1 hypothetical protein [Halomonas maura]
MHEVTRWLQQWRDDSSLYYAKLSLLDTSGDENIGIGNGSEGRLVSRMNSEPGLADPCADVLPRKRFERWLRLIGSIIMTAIVSFVWPTNALASDDTGWLGDEWQEREYRYVIIDQDVRDVLKELGYNLSMPVEISREVSGRVRGDIRTGSVEEFLEQISATNGLAWFFDGGVLHVNTRQEMTQRRFDLEGIDSQRLMDEIERARIGSPLRARLINGESTLQAWGPEPWIDSVARHVERLRKPASRGPSGVRVFRGGTATETSVVE